MGWKDERKRLLDTIRGELKKDIPLHDRVEGEHWDARAAEYLGNREETARIYLDYKRYLGNNLSQRLYLELVSQGIAGKRVLSVGAGLGLDAMLFLERGAILTAIDVSMGFLEVMAMGAGLLRLSPTLVRASAHFLPFEDESFDVIAGMGILHHLNVPVAGPELARVLRPGGKAVFLEPRLLPLPLMHARALVPVECRESPGGGALSRDDLLHLWRAFGQMRIHRFHILEFLCRVWQWLEDRRMAVSKLDRFLLAALPVLGSVARAGVIELALVRDRRA